MKFKTSSNSQKALIITFLLMSISAVLIFQVKLSSAIAKYEEEFYELQLANIEAEEPEELFAEETAKSGIETHKAFNEAEAAKTSKTASAKSEYEKFIDELEQERESNELIAMNFADGSRAVPEYKKYEKKEAVKTPATKTDENETADEAVNKNTSNYYNLVGRKITNFPNPVYTCNTSGKIVIAITVDTYGKVVDTAFNEAASTSSNRCLIETALNYAKNAEFDSNLSKNRQIGTITYIFPGQYSSIN